MPPPLHHMIHRGASPEQIATAMRLPLATLLEQHPDLPAVCRAEAARREVEAAAAVHSRILADARRARAAAKRAETEARWSATVARQESERTARAAGQWWPQWPPGL